VSVYYTLPKFGQFFILKLETYNNGVWLLNIHRPTAHHKEKGVKLPHSYC
jgi:hypothetical protein